VDRFGVSILDTFTFRQSKIQRTNLTAHTKVGDNVLYLFAYWIGKSSTDWDRRNRYSSSSPVRFS
jgi:hypothetical protein